MLLLQEPGGNSWEVGAGLLDGKPSAMELFIPVEIRMHPSVAIFRSRYKPYLFAHTNNNCGGMAQNVCHETKAK